MKNNITEEYLEELAENLNKELQVELEEKKNLINLINFYEALCAYIAFQVSFENIDKKLLIDMHKYAENHTNSDLQSLYAVQSAVKYPEFLELSNFNRGLKH